MIAHTTYDNKRPHRTKPPLAANIRSLIELFHISLCIVHIERTVLKCKQDREVFISMLRGIIVPLVSSFNEDFSLDLQSMRAHIQYLLSQGVNGIFVNASTSEFFSMSPDEQIQIMKLAAEELEDTSSALITGVTSNSTEHSVKLAKMAQEMNLMQ